MPGIGSAEDLARKGIIIQFGNPPNRIDLLNTITGVTFDEAWKDRISESMPIHGQRVVVRYIGLAALIKNKKAVGRPKDLEDLRYLRESAKKAKRPRPT